MNKYTMELNSIRRDIPDSPDVAKITPHSKVVEVFSAMTDGREIRGVDPQTAKSAVSKIKALAQRAEMQDYSAISQLNTIRRYAIEPELMEEIKLLGFFGDYENVGYNDRIEREPIRIEGELSRIQAAGGDPVMGFIVSDRYPVPTVTVSAGYAVDYRKIQFGDMSAENKLKENIKKDIRNKAARYAITTVYNAVKYAEGVKNYSESSGITKAALDNALNFSRKFGTPNIFGDYSVVSQINNLVPYTTNLNASYMNISEAAMEEIRRTGFLTAYNGSLVYAVKNAFDTTQRTADGTSFKTIAPEGLLFIVPTDIDSPVKCWTRGGLTSLTGTDASTGKLVTRYDLEVAVDVAKGLEYKIGLISDTNYDVS